MIKIVDQLCIPLLTQKIKVLTGIVGVVLIFRFSMKAWIRWALPQVSAPERVWGFEDLIFLFGYSLDLLHMTLIQLRYVNFLCGFLRNSYLIIYSYQWGLGRHFYYLSPTEKVQSLRFDFASQPTGTCSLLDLYHLVPLLIINSCRCSHGVANRDDVVPLPVFLCQR